MAICELESSSFLPDIVAKIVLCLIYIWRKVFETSPQRYKEDYIPYTSSWEPPTSCFPNHPVEQHLNRYNVSGKDDEDHCEKTFPSHTDFIDGMFIVGCPCPSPVTYGFELMMGPEYQNEININTQGREQTNALIEKCALTLRQKNYFNFMRYMKIFFAVRNMMATKRLKL